MVFNRTPYSVSNPLSGKSNYMWVFNCQEHGDFEAQYHNVVNHGTCCPRCSKYGFKVDLPAHLYIMDVSLDRETICYKFGVTNSSPNERAKQLERESTFEISPFKSFYYENGASALRIEGDIKEAYREFLVDKKDMLSGYTELFPTHMLEKVISTITNQGK